jgi:hypothetical protein
MNKKLMLLTLFLSLSMLFTIQGFSQALDEDYDRREKAVDPFEDEDKLLREKKISEIINRVKRGDQTVLRLVTFDTFEAVHDEIVKQAENQAAMKGTSGKYYNVIGERNSLPAYIGGFDNQDPKVRLKCIGFLGDWVDEVGVDTALIEKAVDRRLATNIETRKEVRYGYRVLKMKIVRLRVISALKKGDQKILVTITPEEFLPLVFYEPRIRTIYLGTAGAVRIRSIVLDPGVEPETGKLVSSRPGRAEGLDIERICYTAVRESGDNGETAQWLRETRGAGTIEQAAESGGAVSGGTAGTIASETNVDTKCLQAVYAGLDNKSLFVREHCARIFLNYARGSSGDKNYTAGGTRKFNEALGEMARSPYYVRLAQVAWDNVKWSEYYYNDRVTAGSNVASFIRQQNYLEYEYRPNGGVANNEYVPARTKRYFTDSVNANYPEWGTELTGNYRNDVKEICRVLGLSWYIDAEYILEVQKSIVRSRIDTLFNDQDRVDRPRRPDRSDRLEGEGDTSFIGPANR